jgi:hypothetical protein
VSHPSGRPAGSVGRDHARQKFINAITFRGERALTREHADALRRLRTGGELRAPAPRGGEDGALVLSLLQLARTGLVECERVFRLSRAGERLMGRFGL